MYKKPTVIQRQKQEYGGSNANHKKSLHMQLSNKASPVYMKTRLVYGKNTPWLLGEINTPVFK